MTGFCSAAPLHVGRWLAVSRCWLVATVALGCSSALYQPCFAASTDLLAAGFASPPNGARPRVWWHWLSGNIAKPGMTLDMEWMKRVGVGGLQMFDGDMHSPQIVQHRVVALTPEWRDDLRFAAQEASRLGLEFGMAAAPGWSETGGPWVRPEQAMKKLVWSEARVVGGRLIDIKLPAPPAVAGSLQDVTVSSFAAGGKPAPAPFYRDVAVVAYKLADDDFTLAELTPTLTYSGGPLDTAKLIDGQLDQVVTLALPSPGHPTIVQFAFDRPRTMRALTYAGPMPGRFNAGPDGRVQASDDGVAWTTLAALPSAAQSPAPQQTLAFPATNARYFRVVFLSVPPGMFGPPTLALNQLAFVPGARVNAFEDKAGFGVLMASETHATPPELATKLSDVIDISQSMTADGRLRWTPAAGRWAILRMGYSLTGATNHPATLEATGLEVDKLDPVAVQAHLDAYVTPVLRQLGPYAGHTGLQYLLNDSWEAGVQNWTGAMVAEFTRRRGYDPTRWLPVLAGRLIGSAQQSDAFLWDFRRTIADMVAENHYGTITRYARAHGLGYYAEAPGASWPTVADGIQAKSFTDIPMGEFWAIPFGGQPAAFQGYKSNEFPADIAETASTAHIYGKPLVAAESLTSSLAQWTATPWNLKWVADKYMAMGVNRLVIHTSPHQPGTDHVPGLSLGPFSQIFTRNETWAEMARPWIDYLARSCFLLQQGRPVADVLYFYGEGAPSGVPYRERLQPEIPPGYTVDYINRDALLTLVSVKNGRLVTPGGSYALLVLPSSLDRMTAPLAAKLRELVRAGATILASKPVGSPSLGSNDAQVSAIAADLFGGLDGRLATHASYGAGQIYWGAEVHDVLQASRVPPDFDAGGVADLVYAHRQMDDGEIYFVANQTAQTRHMAPRFRVTGRPAEIWHADTGAARSASYQIEDSQTDVSLDLGPYEAVFVVFRGTTTHRARVVANISEHVVARMNGPWTVSFPPGWGAPAHIVLRSLASWTANANSGVRYFSGTATYQATLQAPTLASGGRMVLDLGDVHELARVRINGIDAGIAWKPPYQVDVTPWLHRGANALEVEVADLWHNRLVGDAQPNTARRFTWTSQQAVTGGPDGALGGPIAADTPLIDAGLIGPVRLVAQTAPSATKAKPIPHQVQ